MRTLPAAVLIAVTGALVAIPAHAEPAVTVATSRPADLSVSVPTEVQNYDACPRDLGFVVTGPAGEGGHLLAPA